MAAAEQLLSIESGEGCALFRVEGQLIPISQEQAGLLCQQLLQIARKAPANCDSLALPGRIATVAASSASPSRDDPARGQAH
jgi:hypothetical protein